MALDGKYVTEGSARFSPARPEYLSEGIEASAGRNVMVIQVHYEGVETRILKDFDPCLWIELAGPEGAVGIQWMGLLLDSNKRACRCINPQLAWTKFRDTRKDPLG